MTRVAVVFLLVLTLAGCGGGTNTASRDRCEAAYGVGNCVSRHGTFVPVSVPLGADTTTTGSRLDECKQSQDAARAASAVFYANSSPNHWPATFHDLTTTNPPALTLPDGISATGTTMTGDGWTLTMNASGGSSRPTFSCGV